MTLHISFSLRSHYPKYVFLPKITSIPWARWPSIWLFLWGHVTPHMTLFLKGTVSRDGCFLRPKHVIQYFLSMRWWFSRSFKSFPLPYSIITFLFTFWNCLLILKMLTEIVPRISFSVISRCSLVTTSHWLQGKCASINLSPAAFGIILQKRIPSGHVTRRLSGCRPWSWAPPAPSPPAVPSDSAVQASSHQVGGGTFKRLRVVGVQLG